MFRQESPGRLLRDAAGPTELREIDTAGPDGPPTAAALSRRLTGGSTTAHASSSQDERPALWGRYRSMLAPVGPHCAAARSGRSPRPLRHAAQRKPQACAYVAGGAPSGGAVWGCTGSRLGHPKVEFVDDERIPAGRVHSIRGSGGPTLGSHD
jgi:hypothetical protein